MLSIISELSKYLIDENSIHKSHKTTYNKDKEREVIEYLDIAMCFDLEAYSFIDNGKKCAVMWAYGLAINDTVFLGRTWQEFIDACDYISDYYTLSVNKRVIIWVHNLSYDFQFFRKYFNFLNVFPLDPRKPDYAVTASGIEFRCSYLLTGYSLEKVGENLTKHSIRKLVGEIDYDLPRHPGTTLTDQECQYLEHDCLVVTAHIQEQMEIEQGLAHIPLTKTGYVRRYMRKACFRDTTKKAKEDYSAKAYKDYIASLTLDLFQYRSCKRAFQGGFTHANPQWAGAVLENVTSLDVCSDYPAQILACLYPVTPPEYIAHFADKEDFENTIKTSCCIFTIEFTNIQAVFQYDHYISESRCDIPDDAIRQVNNGRIVKADKLTTTITNIDYFIIRKTYKWDSCKISGFIKWGWGYLPKPIIESTLYMYEQKTQLKGEKGKEVEYLSLKEMLNSIYGMMVTDPLRPDIPYDIDTGEWGREIDGLTKYKIALTPEQEKDALYKYNNDSNRFTYYPWGVFITAYARHMLWSAILEFKDDYIYSDTDSIKCINIDKHMDFINKYNDYMTNKINTCLKYYNIDLNRARPKTIHNIVKPLGVWEKEDIIKDTNFTYYRFKTLGAKRYMVETEKGINITVSGINKHVGVPYIEKYCKDNNMDPFDFFTQGMDIPPGSAGKIIPYYGDDEIAGTVVDYTGQEYVYHELSYVHMSPGGYTLSLSQTYIDYLTLLMRGFLF